MCSDHELWARVQVYTCHVSRVPAQLRSGGAAEVMCGVWLGLLSGPAATDTRRFCNFLQIISQMWIISTLL